jgi:putative transposase
MSKFLKGFKIELDPNKCQMTLFRKHFGASRWAYNWALAKKKDSFDKKEKIPNNIGLHRELNKLKGTDVLPWAYDVSKVAFQSGLINCDRAFQNFFDKCKRKVKGKKGFPKFKSKKNETQSFKLDGSIYLVDKNYIKLPRIGKVKLKESGYIPIDAEIKSVTVSRKSGKWFISCLVESDIKMLPITDKKVGVDLGIKTLATCSDGVTFKNPKALKSNLRKLKRKQRQLSRKKKGSQNYKKARLKFSKLHNRISNIRKDSLHKATTQIIRENQTIVLENLKISNMMKNHCLAQAISDMSAGEFRKQLEYKAKWYGRQIVMSDTFYPSSKMCSCCGWKNDSLTLKDRVFKCEICKNEIDRDLNASKNLLKLCTASSAGIYAFGDGSPVCSAMDKSSPSLKKESNGKFTYVLKR